MHCQCPLLGLSLGYHSSPRVQVLGWTSSMREARALAYELAGIYAEELQRLGEAPGVEGGGGGVEPQRGVRDWLNALTSFNVPVALVSALDRATVRRALERMHLHDHFHVLVSRKNRSDGGRGEEGASCFAVWVT